MIGPASAQALALFSFLGVALVGCATLEAGYPREAHAGHRADQSTFYRSLAPHGQWVSHVDFGWVWYPRHRDRYWRPYTVGRWAWSDWGWMWVSYEPWGWATYHYGRWAMDPWYGWVWIPGRVWGPAWVSWRDCDDYIGWAPLGPWGNGRRRYHDDHHGRDRDHHDRDRDRDHDRDDRDRDGRGGGRGDDRGGGRGDDRDDWNFTRKKDFTSARVNKNIIDRHEIPAVFDRSKELPPDPGAGVSRGVDRRIIERATGRPIAPVKVEDLDHEPGGVAAAPDRDLDRVPVYRPTIEEKPDVPTPDRLGLAPAPSTEPGRGGRGPDASPDGAPGGEPDSGRGSTRIPPPGGASQDPGSMAPAPGRIPRAPSIPSGPSEPGGMAPLPRDRQEPAPGTRPDGSGSDGPGSPGSMAPNPRLWPRPEPGPDPRMDATDDSGRIGGSGGRAPIGRDGFEDGPGRPSGGPGTRPPRGSDRDPGGYAPAPRREPVYVPSRPHEPSPPRQPMAPHEPSQPGAPRGQDGSGGSRSGGGGDGESRGGVGGDADRRGYGGSAAYRPRGGGSTYERPDDRRPSSERHSWERPVSAPLPSYGKEQRPSYERPVSTPRPSYERPAATQRPGYQRPSYDRGTSGSGGTDRASGGGSRGGSSYDRSGSGRGPESGSTRGSRGGDTGVSSSYPGRGGGWPSGSGGTDGAGSSAAFPGGGGMPFGRR